MALTRAQIKEILSKAGTPSEGLDAAIQSIIEGHTSSIDALTEQRDKYKADADKLSAVQAELDKAKEAAKDQKPDTWKVKYEGIKAEFDGYKETIAKQQTAAKKSAAYKALLAEIKISEKVREGVLKLANLDKVELDADGKIKDADTLKTSLTKEWADFIVTDGKKGVEDPNPPAGETKDTSKMTDAEYFEYQRKMKEKG